MACQSHERTKSTLAKAKCREESFVLDNDIRRYYFSSMPKASLQSPKNRQQAPFRRLMHLILGKVRRWLLSHISGMMV